MHDMGKILDRKNHAAVSAELYSHCGGAKLGTHLIANDMLIHSLKAEECENLKKQEHYVLLYLIGLAAINANSFSWGRDSTNYKIKQKHFERRGRKLFCGESDAH